MINMNLRLSLLTFTVLPIMILATVIFKRYARENYRKVRAAISWVNSVLAENINGVRVVQAFSREALNYENFRDEVNKNNLDTNLQAARIASAFPSVIDFLGAAATALVVWIGGIAVISNTPGTGDAITPGVLVAFLLYINRFFDPIRDLSRRYDSFQSTMAGSERIFALLDAPIEVQDEKDAIQLPEINGDILLDGVSFQYPDAETNENGSLVLEDINLHIPAGKTVALVGETGAGKSILVGALGLICGERGQSDLVRAGAAKAILEAEFSIASDKKIRQLLHHHQLETTDSQIIIRREINIKGRNISLIKISYQLESSSYLSYQ